MADRRMFAKSIVLSDAFLDMPLSARCLYFTLGMLADDDGFVGNPKAIMRQCGASQDDMLVLLQKRYILGFDSGIIVIKHWRINNYLREDRHKNTTYLEEKNTLMLDEKGAYTELKDTDCLPLANQVTTKCQPSDNQVPEVGIPSIDKDSIDKNSINNNRGRFTPPTVDEVKTYCQERHNGIDAQTFIDFYESKGWLIGKNKMKDWKAAVRTWEKRRNEPKKTQFHQIEQNDYNFDELEKKLLGGM